MFFTCNGWRSWQAPPISYSARSTLRRACLPVHYFTLFRLCTLAHHVTPASSPPAPARPASEPVQPWMAGALVNQACVCAWYAGRGMRTSQRMYTNRDVTRSPPRFPARRRPRPPSTPAGARPGRPWPRLDHGPDVHRTRPLGLPLGACATDDLCLRWSMRKCARLSAQPLVLYPNESDPRFSRQD